ncbi:MAG TPA: glycosyltransferase, partial [Acidimicrobiia bacterium]
PKRRRSTYYAIAGTSAARLGKRREALELTAASIRTDPTSWARYRNLAGVVRSCLRRPPRGAPAGRARVVEDRSAHSPSEHQPGGMHGVVITFNRPESLSRVIDNLAGAGLTSLTIVDNAPSEASRAVAVAAATRLAVTYVPMEENSGPAGGIAEGMGRVLAGAASDDDWIVLLDDDGIPGPPGTIGVLRDFGEWLIARGAPVGAVGLAGAMFDARRGQLVRPSDEELSGPITVSYVAGNQLPTIRVASARKIGVFDADLFFGFDDLDYCLRLGRGGYGVYASGPVWLAHRRNVGRIGPAVGPPPRRENAWRRYYAVRNHIVIMRRYTTWSRALAVTAGHLFWRPISDLLRRRPGVRGLVRAGTRGCVDAWANRLGRRVEPTPGS